MSCNKNDNSVSVCCHPAELIVDKFCMPMRNVNGEPPPNIWRDQGGHSIVLDVSVDSDSPGPMSIVAITPQNQQTSFQVQPGKARTVVLDNVERIRASASAGGFSRGKACLTVFRKFFC